MTAEDAPILLVSCPSVHVATTPAVEVRFARTAEAVATTIVPRNMVHASAVKKTTVRVRFVLNATCVRKKIVMKAHVTAAMKRTATDRYA